MERSKTVLRARAASGALVWTMLGAFAGLAGMGFGVAGAEGAGTHPSSRASAGASAGASAAASSRADARPGAADPMASPGLGPIRFFAADRDAGQISALDADLIEVRRFAAPFAVELEPRSDGRLWVVAASALGPLGPHWLRRYDPHGALEFEAPVGSLYDLACLDGDWALLVTQRPDGLREASATSGAGAAQTLAVGAALSTIAGRAGGALVGSHDGWLRSYRVWPTPALAHERDFGGVIADVAPGPERGSFYVLDVAGAPSQRRLALVNASLATVWVRALGCSALHLAVTPDAQRVWVADGGGRFARRFGVGGVLEISFAALPAAGCERGVAEAQGGAVFAAPGALVRLAADGAVLPGQGGFDFLVDVAVRNQP
jgi:hypothetical protein